MSGTANRLGIIAFRVMMIFSALRAHEAGTLNNSIRCSDTDFNNALAIVDRLEKHAKSVYDYLDGQPEKKSLASMLFKEDKSYGEISKIIFGNGNHKGTIHKWLNKNKTNTHRNDGKRPLITYLVLYIKYYNIPTIPFPPFPV